MQISLLLAHEIAQLFLILLAGFVLVRAGLLRAADSKVLSVILVYLVIPCVIIDAFQIEDTPAIRAGLAVSFAAAAAIHLLFLVLTGLLRRFLGLDAIERATAIYSNAGALVIPLVQALLGQEYVIYSCAFIIVQLVLLWTHGSMILRGAGALSWKAILTNVNLLSIAAGAVLYAGRIPLPAVLSGAMDDMGALMGPLGMLLAGMAIAESPLRQLVCTPRYYLTAALRLVVYPLAALVLLWATGMAALLPDGRAILMTVYLAAITPACTTITSMVQLYGQDAGKSSALYVMSTLLSIVTMPLMLAVFDWVI
ncbi:AEC family transporter [Faecalibacterium sp. An121]|uniref:AEC family transporter n=1 Tax=Faecalibacterium sp. An121 TaxID=1965550 RepID=UPI000B389DA0|nr:AEC family transporter [Faecalibacterium sp. An121]OUQ39627.1 autotransporter [Faecalibacterium sp. An121]